MAPVGNLQSKIEGEVMGNRNFGYSPQLTRTLYKRREEPSSPNPVDWPLIGLLALISIGTGMLLALAFQMLGAAP